jgi:thiamine biosynthesis lipoprotein
LSATVVAPTAAEADALATAFYILGVAPALDYCRRHPRIGTILVTRASGSERVEVHTAGLSDGDLRLFPPDERPTSGLPS